jgi:regulator of replication initiation timing
MVKQVDSHSSDPLLDGQLELIRAQAQRLLRQGTNLFAEIALRLIETYEAQGREVERLRHSQAERQIEAEFLARENQELRSHIAEMEIERRRMIEQIRQQQKEMNELRRAKLQLPPSWE